MPAGGPHSSRKGGLLPFWKSAEFFVYSHLAQQLGEGIAAGSVWLVQELTLALGGIGQSETRRLEVSECSPGHPPTRSGRTR
jgi:hypothetical protein